MVYQAIVRSKVRAAWAQVNARDVDAVIDQLAPKFEYRFVGEHAMGGRRTSKVTLAEWFARVFRLFPDIQFEVQDVLVAGPPWRTRAVALVRVHGATADGAPYENELSQTLAIRFGRITRITTLEDTQKLSATLEKLGRQGVSEATAAPLTDLG